MKILVIGSSGKVGEAVTRLLSNETTHTIKAHTSGISPIELYFSNTCRFDVNDKVELKKQLASFQPDVVVNCAAYTNVDACESEKQTAWEVNAGLPETLAQAANLYGFKLIHFSTDYIFDGKSGPYIEEDIPEPLSYYGKSKLAGENAIKKAVDNYSIVRTNVVYGRSSFGKKDLIHWIADQVQNNVKPKLITGQWCNPTLSDDLARGVMILIERGLTGVYNIAGADYCNKYEVGIKVASYLGRGLDSIEAADPATFIQPAQRPEKGGLVTLKAEAIMGFRFAGIEAGLQLINYQGKQ